MRPSTAFKKKLADHGFTISALSCHSNPLHPNQDLAQKQREISRKTILLAERLGVKTVIDFSGCPGDSFKSTQPNWVTCPWPPEYLDVLKWQWDEVVTPYWIEHAKFAANHGVRIAIEMHPGFVVYSPETMQRLRSIAGDCNWLQLRPKPHVLAGNRSHRSDPHPGRCDFSRARQRHANV